MARSARQSKILEIISTKEIEKQDELARELKNANFEITQATISRDIKELGLTKILSSSGKYKYCFVGSEDQVISNKYISIFGQFKSKNRRIWKKIRTNKKNFQFA